MKIKEITSYLESLAPLGSQASFDNCGLLVGDSQAEITGVLVCLDCTEEVLEEAMDLGANLIIAHHPLIFGGLKKITGRNYVERTVIKAIQNNLAIYAIHTNLDHSINGVNAEIARRIGVKNPRILLPNENVLSKLIVYTPSEHVEQVEEALFEAGAGRIGNYSECNFSSEGIGSFKPMPGSNPFEGEIGVKSKNKETKIEVLVSNHILPQVLSAMRESHPYEEVAYDVLALKNSNQEEGSGMIGTLEFPAEPLTFLAKLKQTFHCGIIRHTNLPDKPIKTVAFCGGSGSFLLPNAIQQKADIFITGDYKYHDFFDADNQIVIADIGHFESEQFTTNLIVSLLTEKFTKFAVHNTRVITNPINYF
ncbi:MAG: Nif3-like dinuclear metal center hexameric protein [Crocinitomicaceae bacterium]|nr:Nif3-like dinuclear metal center hexameric protein [Crocinitomicaceae bacterium]